MPSAAGLALFADQAARGQSALGPVEAHDSGSRVIRRPRMLLNHLCEQFGRSPSRSRAAPLIQRLPQTMGGSLMSLIRQTVWK